MPHDPFRSPDLYFNRELSWLEFNDRVLSQGTADDLPLLERVKFLAIVSSNLDEFFLVRVAGLMSARRGCSPPRPAGMTPARNAGHRPARAPHDGTTTSQGSHGGPGSSSPQPRHHA